MIITKKCLYCKKEFKKKYGESCRYWKTKKYCSQECYWKAKKGEKHSKEHIEKIRQSHLKRSLSRYKKCEICGKEFRVCAYRLKARFCSYKCYWKYKIGKKATKETKRKQSEFHIGLFVKEKHPQWIEDRSFLIYPDEFNNKLREKIRQRDNYRCQECGIIEKQLNYNLSIHHIDYIKKNNKEDNLISLCKNCHTKTNFKRKDWQNYFQNKLNV